MGEERGEEPVERARWFPLRGTVEGLEVGEAERDVRADVVAEVPLEVGALLLIVVEVNNRNGERDQLRGGRFVFR